MTVTDLAHAILPSAKFDFVGIRPGQKVHEQMVGVEDAHLNYEYDKYFKILPAINNWTSSYKRIINGKLVKGNFIYDSETNTDRMSVDRVSAWVQSNRDKL